ncbi:MAG: Dioxygenase, partial [Thermoleophilia bacterium]|nr:Dioxygenase [Thermoleophilia bacterium]
MSPFRYMTIMALALALGGCGDYGSDTEPESTTSTRAPAPATTEQDAAPAGAADACPAAPTPAQTEGPYFSPGAPRKADLAQDGDGDVIVVRGAVYDATCAPAAGLRIDFWQTDADGVYDNDGFRFRGHQLTNATGGY